MSSHLSQQDIQALKQNLLERSAVLKEEIHSHLSNSGVESYAEIAGKVHDRGEESVAELLADVNYHVTEAQVKEIKAIESALDAMNNHLYGVCVDCDASIPLERLQAFPTATRCVACQQQFEEK